MPNTSLIFQLLAKLNYLGDKMCGICGIADFSGTNGHYNNNVRQMASALSHRGPDAEGFYTDSFVALGHRRLSIIDLTDSANQPLEDVSGRYAIVFNGEIYNFREVRDKLSSYPFQTEGDTEVILAAFAAWGPACVEHFKGMFAFAVWDSEQRMLCLCRDRLGVKPLYYHIDGKRIIFASEIRSLLASDLIEPVLDTSAIYDFLSFQSFYHPLSPIQGIMPLDAGTYLQIGPDTFRKTKYWMPGNEFSNFDFNDEKSVRHRTRELLLAAVSRRLVSDVPVAAFLSGGIDSSVIVALMSEVSSDKPATFNVSFSEKAYDESDYALLISKKFNTRHHSIHLQENDFLDQLVPALDAMDSPSGDGPNTYIVSTAIRKSGIKVALSGVGGDELFAGYPFFTKWLQMQRYHWLFDALSGIRKPMAKLLANARNGKMQRMATILATERMDIDQMYPIFRRILPERLLHELTLSDKKISTSLEKHLSDIKSHLHKLPLLSQISVAEYEGYTQHTLLKDTDQMSMAASLEIREPFFDHELVDFILQVPDRIKFPRYPKSLLVESVHPLLPNEIVHRRKQGFLFPWKIWMKNELSAFCEDKIKAHADRPFIQGNSLLAYWNRFLSGDRSVRWQELWQFVVLEHWLQKNNVR